MRNITKKKVWIVLLPVGIVFVIMGIMQDDYYDTWLKAITICLECIGIG
jgi:hypothetical protein